MVTVSRRAAIVALAPAFLVGLVILEVVSYLSLERYGRGIDGMPTVAWEEFPDVDRELLEKFSSFDATLGWEPRPNTEKRKDTGDHLPGEELKTVVTYSTDEYGSRVCPAAERDPAGDATVSTYGDSYCFCRGVDDDETIQHYLARTLDTHVGNYGAGNYGIDQALLRLKETYPDDPSDYVLMVVTASSIARILSVWKHYQEFGNVLAVKPRYTLANGSLDLLESPVDEKADLQALEDRAEALRSADYHHDPWFGDHLASFPYLLDFLGTPDNVRYAVYGAIEDLERRFDTSLPGIDPGVRKRRTELRMQRERVEYHDDLFDRKADLFSAVVGDFVSYADEQGFTPVLVMVQQLRYAKHEPDGGRVYGDLLDRLDKRYSPLQTIDMTDHLDAGEDVESLYIQRGEGGHYSPETNERIAEVLATEVFEQSSRPPVESSTSRKVQ